MNSRPRVAFRNIGKLILAAGTLAISFSSFNLTAQENAVKDIRYYTQRAMQAYRAKDYATYLENMKQAQVLRSDHPTYMYNLASAYALNGNKRDAITWLRRVADMGFTYPADSDDDFASIRNSEEFKDLLKKFDYNRSPITHSTEAFTLAEKGLVTEGIAYDSTTGTFYVSSIHKRKIISMNRAAEVRDFSTKQDGLWSVFGMKVDTKRRFLWVCSAAMPQMSGFTEADKNRTGVFKFDLKTGTLVKKYLLPETTKGHVFGDLAIHPSGDVYVTDSVTAGIYLITTQHDELEKFAGPEPFISPQGLDFSSDGKRLFVTDYLLGLFVFDLKSKKLTKIEHTAEVSVFGLDGLYFHKGTIVAIQNGASPQRVVRFYLNSKQDRIMRAEVIESNNPLCDEPTLGVIVNNTFYFIANSQWSVVDEHATLGPAEKLRKPLVLKTNL